MNSCIYEGMVKHRRLAPAAHTFRYSLFMMFLDLDELDTVFKGRWFWSARAFSLAWFRRADHHGDPGMSLAAAIRDLVEDRTGSRPPGAIRLLTHLRYFGYCFNPVSFYFCYDLAGEKVETVVAEINNTPWGERYCYVLGAAENTGSGRIRRHRLEKRFHISPFMEMNLSYDWRFIAPEDTFWVHMENLKNGQKFFDASMVLRRREVTGRSLAAVLARHPFMTGKVIAAIYYNALRLWMKKCPFYGHSSGGTLARPSSS